MRTVRRIGQFRVAAGVFGRIFTVIERKEFNWTEGNAGPEAIPGASLFETTEGYALTPLGDDRYEIAALGLLVRRIPPGATVSRALAPGLSDRLASTRRYGQREQAETQ